MIKNRKKRRHTGYCPVKRTSRPPKRKKVHDFESKGQSERINLCGCTDVYDDSVCCINGSAVSDVF